MAEGKEKPPTLPRHVLQIIATPLPENNVGSFLSNLADYTSSAYLPSTELIQILIYLSLVPPSQTLNPGPTYLLHRILVCHSPSDFAHSLPTPHVSQDGVNVPWKAWHVEADHLLGRQTVRMMAKCREGIWDILWGPRGEDDDRIVGSGAWELLGWLVDVWEKDQEEYAALHPAEVAYSPMFISQLSGPSVNLVPDNASPLLDIAKSAFAPSPSKVGQHQRIELAVRLFGLLINATLHRPPKFHPPSLVLSFLTLLRSTLSQNDISTFLSYLHPRVEPYVLTHIYAIAIEDLAGVRVSRAAQRKKARAEGRSVRDFEGDKRFSPFPPPTISFLLSDLLLRRPAEGRETRMGIIKLALVGLMMSLHSPGTDDWTRAIVGLDDTWMDKIKAVVLVSSEGGDRTNGAALVALLQSLYPAPPPSAPPPLPASPPQSQKVTSARGTNTA